MSGSTINVSYYANQLCQQVQRWWQSNTTSQELKWELTKEN